MPLAAPIHRRTHYYSSARRSVKLQLFPADKSRIQGRPALQPTHGEIEPMMPQDYKKPRAAVQAKFP
jgi:hypothetical protein